MLAYQRDVVSEEHDSVSVENFARKLVNRPTANRLQVRGYLNAYNNVVKLVLEDVSEKERIIAFQRALQVLGFDLGNEVDTGVIGEKTRLALFDFKTEHRGEHVKPTDPKTERLDPITQLLIEQKVESVVSAEEFKALKVAFTGLSLRVAKNSLLRRSIRLSQVLQYKNSLESQGKLTGGLLG